MEGDSVMKVFYRSPDLADWSGHQFVSVEDILKISRELLSKYESYEEYPGITICEDENELPQLNIGITHKGFIAIINFEENGDFNQLDPEKV